MPNFPFTVGDSLRIGTADITASGGNIVLPAGTQVGNQPVATTVEVSTGGGPKITNLQVTSNVYAVLDDTAVETTGGFIKITGTNFVTGCMVYVASTPANSTTFVSSTEVRAALPATAAGTYPLYLVNPDGGTAIRVPGVTFSASPAWQTASNLGEQYDGVLITLNLIATDATLYTLTSGSLPPGLSLAGNTGVISGTVSSVVNDTVYTFTITATDTQLQDSPRTFTVTLTVSDPLFKVTTLLLGGELGTNCIKDSSTNNIIVTVNGDSRVSNFSPYIGAWSVYFDGTGDYLTVPSSGNTEFNFGTGNFTIEGWFYTLEYSGWVSFFGISQGGGASTKINLYDGNTGTLSVDINGSAAFSTSAIKSLITNNWTHIALVREGTGTNQTKLYLNGLINGQGTVSASFSFTNPFYIGHNGEVYLNAFKGYISSFRVVKGVAVYSANFTPATSSLTSIANTSLLTCHVNSFRDASNNNFTITRVGDAAISSFNPYNLTNTGDSGSMYFDGTGDTLLVPNSAALNCDTSNFTLECWVYIPTAPAVSYPSIFGCQTLASYGASLRYGNTGYTNKFTFHLYGVASWVGDPFLASASTFPLAAWYHVAVTRSGNTFTLWINGVSQATGTSSSQVNFTPTNGVLVAGSFDGASGNFNGYVSDLRIVKGTALYTTSFTPPTQSLTSITNTQLLICQYKQSHNNHGFVDSSGNNFLITRSGNVTQGAFSPFAPTGWSIYLGASDQVHSTTSSPSVVWGSFNSTGTFTMEFWLYASSFTGWQIIADQSGSLNYLMFSIDSSSRPHWYWYSGAGYTCTSTQTVTANRWTHVATTLSSGAISIYIDGVKSTVTGTTSAGGGPGGGTGRLAIGSGPFYISNLRVIKNQALFTANFTPGTASLTTTTVGHSGSGVSASITGNVSLLLASTSSAMVDRSFNRTTFSTTATPLVYAWSPFGSTAAYTPSLHGGSAYFDATSDYLMANDIGSLEIAGNNFCFEFFYYPIAASNTDFIVKRANTSSYGFLIVQSSLALQLWLSSNGSSWDLFSSQALGTVTQGMWNHVSIYRIGNAWYSSLNGNITTLSASKSGSIIDNAVNWQIGGNNYASAGINGYLSNFRLVIGSSVYTSTSAPIPTAPLTAITNTHLLLSFTNASILDRTAKNILETQADTKAGAAQIKFGTGSMSFDGTGDILAIPDSRLFDFGNSDWTIEFWVYRTVNAQQVLIAKRTSNVPTGMPVIYFNTSSKIITDFNAQTGLTPTGTVALNTWTHVAIVRSGSGSNNVKIYFNGAPDPTTASWTTLTTNTSPMYIGGDSNGNYFTGFIDDLRITQSARYTTTFTPPTGSARLK